MRPASLLLMLCGTLLRVAATGTLVGVVTGSPALGAASAGTAMALLLVWRNHVLPSRIPKDLFPPTNDP